MRTFEVGDFVTDGIGGHLYVVMKVLPRDTYLIGSRRWGIREEHISNLVLNDDGVPRPHITPAVVAGYWIRQLIDCIQEEVEK